MLAAAEHERDGAAFDIDRPRLAGLEHVALVITALGAGGAERVMVTMANHWCAAGIRVSLITYEALDARSYYPLDERIEVIRLGLADGGGLLRKGPLLLARRIAALRRTFLALHPDVAIAFLSKVNIATLLAARGSDMPVIVSERNHPDRQGLGAVWRWLRDRTYRSADMIVFQTEAARQGYPDHLQARAAVIANPVRRIAPSKQPEARHQLTAVGRLTPQKGFDLLLQAFAKIASDFPDWRLVIWGEGPDREALERARARLGLEAGVSLPGLTEDAGGWIERTGIFVLSSRYEGMPNVLLEAMTAGLPVVAFDCPAGPAELLEDGRTGLLVPPEDVDALSAALASLMADRPRRQALAAGAAEATLDYQIDPIMAKWAEAIDAARQKSLKAGADPDRT